jgi:hypothetical protein
VALDSDWAASNKSNCYWDENAAVSKNFRHIIFAININLYIESGAL